MQLNRLNVIPLFLSIPIIIGLSGCAEKVSLKNDSLASTAVTSSNEIVVPDDKPSVPDGKAIWSKLSNDKDAKNAANNCASCHGMGGEGGAKTSVNFADKDFMRKQKPADQFATIWVGKNNHPALNGVVSRRDAWNLVFYVRSLAVAPLTDPEVQDISAAFGSNCAVCHGTKGYGDGPLAHNLEPQPANFQNYARFYDRTDDVLWDHIANGIKWEGMPNFLNKQDKAKNITFDKEYIWKLVQYVRHFHESTESTVSSNATESSEKSKNSVR
jgi:mono/diheme cytochrome c family protein